MQTYEVGEPRQLSSVWWDTAGEGVEPSSITLTVTAPDGTVSTYTKPDLTQGATTAEWFRWYTPTSEGVWRFNFSGIVGASTVEQGGAFLAGEGQTTSGPCEPWCAWEDVERCGAPPELTPEAQELAIDQASGILYDLSDRFYPGLCTTTRALCFACQSCAPSSCSCTPYPSLDLASGFPVWDAYDVVVDGVTLAQSAHHVVGRRYLTRTDGENWPSGSDTADPDAFRVTWIYGRQPPTAGRLAAARFAFEIARLCAGDRNSALPQRVTNIQREGVTYTILDSMGMIAEGRTGLALVDLWLEADRRGRKPNPHIYHPALGGNARYPA